jgi:DNA (cytosine-5)-methyltransferase 1
LALPRDTICGDESDETYYAIGNELFFSDRCNCKDVDLKDIFSVHDVSIFTDYAEEGSDFFIHMLYREVEQTFVHVKAGEDLPRCKCRGYPKKKYANATTKPPSADEPTQKKNDNHGPAKMLDNLSLFSGCGLLDHSFGAGSAGLIQTKLAVEHGEMALLSHKANDDDETKARCHYEVGSVNDVLRRFMTGKEPMKHFHCLTAGCPCQGYSQINAHKNTTKAYRNCSLLAHTISWIEVFMPAYAVIENVPNMDKMRPNACAQAICHLVALGYQVRKLLCSVSHLGGVSRRERLIILAAAPGVALPEAPPQTHSAAASLEFGGGSREIRTAGEAISDLTPVHNDATVNIADPDHLPLERLKVDFAENINYRSLVQQIPTRPKSMSLAKTYHAGGLLPDQRKWFETLAPLKQHPKKSRCLMRTDAGQPFRTVCTRISPMDAIFSGEILHPTQDRVVSMKESRRAMDVPDNFLLVGKLAEQYKMLGNAVPWSLGAALGRAVGRSWRAGVKGVEARKGLDPKPQKEEEEKVSLALAVSRVAVSSSPAAPKRHRESPSPAVDPDDSDSSSVVFLEERAVKKARPE